MITALKVFLGSDCVGELVSRGRSTAFQYDSHYLEQGISISPIKLPLNASVYPANDRDFSGLAGVFADSLPDTFGRVIMKRWFQKNLGVGYEPLGLDMLAYVGDSGMGALRYRPLFKEGAYEETYLFDLKQEERRIRELVRGSSNEFIDRIRQTVGSVGGSYPKALVAINPATKEWMHEHPTLPSGFKHYILKFGDMPSTREPLLARPEVEQAFLSAARTGGITVPDSELVPMDSKEGMIKHLLIERFDIQADRRLHMASLSGLLEVSATQLGGLDYRDYFGLVESLGMGELALKEVFRRMTFNYLANNADDHGKNHAFLLNNGDWTVSPAYDLTFTHRADHPHALFPHNLGVAGKVLEVKRNDLIRLGERSGIAALDCSGMIDKIAEAVSTIPQLARENGLELVNVAVMADSLERTRKGISPLKVAFSQSASTQTA